MILTLVDRAPLGQQTTNLFIDFKQMLEVDQQTHQQRKIRRSDVTFQAGLFSSIAYSYS